jgi:hypothetical protein
METLERNSNADGPAPMRDLYKGHHDLIITVRLDLVVL